MAKPKRSKASSAAKDARRRKRKQTAGTSDSQYRPGPLPQPRPQQVSADQRREMVTQANALQFLLNYLHYVRDGGFNVPADQFGPRRPDETPEQAELRREVARRTKEVQALAGNWADLCAEVLGWVEPGTAAEVASVIVDVGRGWLKSSRVTPDHDAWLVGAQGLLGVLCPADQMDDAFAVLDQMNTMEIVPGDPEPQLDATAAATPAATTHAAAALVAWLFGTRTVVADQTAALRKLAEKAMSLSERIQRLGTADTNQTGPGSPGSRTDGLGILFLLNYLSFVEDERKDLDKNVEPQRADESDEDFVQRQDIRRMKKEIQAITSDYQHWAQSADEDLRQVRAEQAGTVAASLLALGRTWCEKAEFTPPTGPWHAGAAELLDAMCPPEYRDDAQVALDTLCVPDAQHEAFAEQVTPPMARPAIHAAAALTTWLYYEPDCVPDADRAQLGLDLGDKAAAIFGQPR